MSNETNKFANPIISRELASDNGVAQSIPCGSSGTSPASSIQVIKDGDVIRAINVHCRCGEVIEVVCNYE